MAQFQMRHERQGGRGYLLKLIGAIIGLGMLIYIIWSLINLSTKTIEGEAGEGVLLQLQNRYYNLGYDTSSCKPVWGTYRMHLFQMDTVQLQPKTNIRPDARLPGPCRIIPEDEFFLVPPAHMHFDSTAWSDVFLSSNVRSLENNKVKRAYRLWNHSVSQWIYQKNTLYLTVGFTSEDILFACVATHEPNETAVGLLFDPQRLNLDKMEGLYFPVDSFEHWTGLDLFSDVITSDVEPKVEAVARRSDWPLIK